MPIRVALIDDDQAVHNVIADLLRKSSEVTLVGQCFRAEESLQLCQITTPDIVLMDIVMPGMQGAEATRLLVESNPGVKVLALSSYHEHEHIMAMLGSGATSYLVKDALVDDLIDTILMTHQGNTVLSPSVRESLIAPPTFSKDTFGLTPREMDVVELMGQGQSNRQIATSLNISSSTVSFHLDNILGKMQLQTRSELLVVAAKHHMI